MVLQYQNGMAVEMLPFLFIKLFAVRYYSFFPLVIVDRTRWGWEDLGGV